MLLRGSATSPWAWPEPDEAKVPSDCHLHRVHGLRLRRAEDDGRVLAVPDLVADGPAGYLRAPPRGRPEPPLAGDPVDVRAVVAQLLLERRRDHLGKFCPSPARRLPAVVLEDEVPLLTRHGRQEHRAARAPGENS